MVIDAFQNFLDDFLKKIDELGINIIGLDLDHLGYQTSSSEDYENVKQDMNTIGTLVDENIVGERRVGLYKLHTPLKYNNYLIKAIEIIEPKNGQICPSALEHGEFVIGESFETFMEKYPKLNWDTSALNQSLFPLLKLRLSTNMQVKFQHESVLKIAASKEER